MKTITLLMAFLFVTANLFAQADLDSIYTRKGEVLVGKVKEIGHSEIRYIQPQTDLEVVYVLLISDIDRIVFSGGQVQKFEPDAKKPGTIEANSEELFLVQNKNALKIDFLALAANTLTLTYERCLRPGRSFEFSGGIIGMGLGLEDEDASGFLLRGGFKFARNPDFYMKEMRYSHILKGSYLKLELDFANYSVTGSDSFFENDKRYDNTKWAFLVVMGKQWVYSDSFLIDFFSGIGLGGNSLENLDLTYPYGFATLGEDFPLAFSFGLRLGFLL